MTTKNGDPTVIIKEGKGVCCGRRPYTMLSGLWPRGLRLRKTLAPDHFVAAGGPVDRGVDGLVGVDLGGFRRRLHHFGIGEMLLDVGARAEQAVLFAGP